MNNANRIEDQSLNRGERVYRCVSEKSNLISFVGFVGQRKWLILFALFFSVFFHSIAYGQEQIKIGVLAFRGAEETMARWTPTAEYLSVQIPEYVFVIVPLDFEEIYEAVEYGEVDFVLANSSIYVELEYKYGVDRIATLQDLWQGQAFDEFGGVIFTKKNRKDINSLDDLKNKSFMAVHETSFGGWRMAQREFKDYGIDPYRDFAELQFGGTHDKVVYAVQEGLVDAGTVRTGILERMDEEGKIDIRDFRILNQQYPDIFSLLVSTCLYPEWPLARVKHTSEQLAQQVSVVLLSMPSDSEAARGAGIHGWTIPHQYQQVHDCLKELRVSPYEEFGEITFLDIIQQYWGWMLAGLIGIVGLAAVTIYISGLNHELNLSRIALEKSHNRLVQRVDERTSELRKRNRQFKLQSLALESAANAIVITDVDGNIQWANPAFSALTGYSLDEALGQNPRVLKSGQHDEAFYKNMWDTIIAGKVWRGELINKRKNGSLYTEKMTIAPFSSDGGKISNFVAIKEDITERKEAEEALRKSEERYRNIYTRVEDVIYETDYYGSITGVSPSVEKHSGYRPEELIGQNVTDFFVYPDEYAALDSAMEAEGSVNDFELNMRKKNGDVIVVSITSHIVFNEDGHPVKTEGVLRDITERKRTEKALRESEKRYRLLFDLLPYGGEILDTNGIIINCSPSTARMLGYEMSELIGKHAFELFDPDSLKVVRKKFSQLLKGKPQSADVRMIRKDGTKLNVLRAAQPILDDKGNVEAFLTLSVNITERVQAEKAIQQYLRRLDALHKIDQAITSSLDLKITLSVLLDQLLTQLEVDAAAVLLYEKASQTLTFSQVKGFRSTDIHHTSLRLGKRHAGVAALQRRPVFIPDLNQPGAGFSEPSRFKEEGFVAYYGVPLIAKGALVGVLEIFHRSTLDPEDEWVEFLKTLAGQAAIAIDNIILFDGLQRSNMELALAYDATIEGWARTLELHDVETEGHSRRVVDLTITLALKMGMKDKEMANIYRGALLHDIGKMGIPDRIMQKSKPFTNEERQIIQQHPVYAYELLFPIEYLRPALDIPYCHHEKWDGTGYPRGLQGKQIPLAARIFAVVDVWDALRSDRPYRKAWSKEKALKHIEEQSGIYFDPQIVDIFLEHIRSQQKE